MAIQETIHDLYKRERALKEELSQRKQALNNELDAKVEGMNREMIEKIVARIRELCKPFPLEYLQGEVCDKRFLPLQTLVKKNGPCITATIEWEGKSLTLLTASGGMCCSKENPFEVYAQAFASRIIATRSLYFPFIITDMRFDGDFDHLIYHYIQQQ